jgi:hypothetical protein
MDENGPHTQDLNTVPASEFFPTTMHIPHLTPAAKQFHCLFNKLSSFVLDLPKIITGYISKC